jgi:hypothetical protein
MDGVRLEPAPVVGPRASVSAGEGAADRASVDGHAREELGIPWLPESVAAWSPGILEAGRRHAVAPELVAIVALVESGGHPEAVSPSGAVGLMQVMPATAADIARRRGIDPASVELTDPEQSLDFGAWYLADQLKRFGRAEDPDWRQSVAFAAAAYNGGPGSLERHVSGGTPLPAETVSYQTWVTGMWRERRDARSATFERWLAAGGWRLVDAASTNTVALAGPAQSRP